MKTLTMLMLAVVVASGCATSSGSDTSASGGATPVTKEKDLRGEASGAQLRSVLESLPKCEAGAEAGRLSIAPTTCTKRYCGPGTCCNQCSWAATFEGKNTMKVPVEAGRVRQVLKLGEGGLDCEVAAWGQVLETVSMAVEGTACVVR